MGQAAQPLWMGICRSWVGKGGWANWEAGSVGCPGVATTSLGSTNQSPKWGAACKAGGDHSNAFPGRPHCPEQAAVTPVFAQALVETPFNISPGLQKRIPYTKGTHSFWELFMKIPESQLCQMTQQTPGAAPRQSSFGGNRAGGSERAG